MILTEIIAHLDTLGLNDKTKYAAIRHISSMPKLGGDSAHYFVGIAIRKALDFANIKIK